MRRTIRFALLTSALIVTATSWPTAYVLNGPNWGTRTVNYYINPANADVSEAQAEAAIQFGAATWGSQSNADFRFYYVGRTPGSSLTNNGKNEVFFRNASNGNLIAEAYWWADASNHLIDADVVFYDGAWQFRTSSTGCSNGFYLEDTAAHELGHALGLGHSPDPAATMYYAQYFCSQDWRTLESDDLAAVEALYPPSSSNSAPTVSITSPGNRLSVMQGTTLMFSGSASDKQDGDLTSRMTWSSNLIGQFGYGGSFDYALPGGTHAITTSVTDNAGATSTSQITITLSASNLTPSADGTTTPPASQIVDNTLNVWTLSGKSILRNGQYTAGEGSIIAWCGGQIAVFGTDYQWWNWGGGGWYPIGTTSTCGATTTQPYNPPPSSSISLTATGYRLKQGPRVDLSWSGATSSSVDIYRNGTKITTTANDGTNSDSPGRKTSGTVMYKVCDAGTSSCSNTASVIF